nr:AAA family ATPase [Candidatus Gracilibacteria bacterium]
MINLIEKNLEFIKNYPIFQDNNEFIKKIVGKLNNDRIVVITGMRGLHKTSIIKEFLDKTGNENFIYFNDDLDTENLVKDDKEFFNYVKTFENKYNNCNIVILQNINKLQNIKNIILELYKRGNYKILIIGNNIHIDKTRELEVSNNLFQNDIEYSYDLLSNYLEYGILPDIKLLNNNFFKKSLLEHIKNKIVLKDIINNYSIKSDFLFNQVITKIALLEKSLSIRELHRNIKDQGTDISLITLMDYLDFAVNAKIIKRSFTYDLKLDKVISTKVRYYFTDIGIRNTFAGKKLDNKILIENLIYNDLITKYSDIYNGSNGRFDFSFYIKDNSNFIHISNKSITNEIKKETNKLDKIEQKGKKVMILSSLDIINFEKEINGVKVIGIGRYKK